jgi:hypothetical protein
LSRPWLLVAISISIIGRIVFATVAYGSALIIERSVYIISICTCQELFEAVLVHDIKAFSLDKGYRSVLLLLLLSDTE